MKGERQAEVRAAAFCQTVPLTSSKGLAEPGVPQVGGGLSVVE